MHDHLVLLPLQLRHINNQWAQDYESLIQKMQANSTGYYSAPSSTTMECTQCLQLEKRLDESRNEVCQMTAQLETLQHTIHQRNQQVAHLENANRAIQIQVGCPESSSSSWCNSIMFIDVHMCVYCHNIAAMATVVYYPKVRTAPLSLSA